VDLLVEYIKKNPIPIKRKKHAKKAIKKSRCDIYHGMDKRQTGGWFDVNNLIKDNKRRKSVLKWYKLMAKY
jgi:hypothetical protein